MREGQARSTREDRPGSAVVRPGGTTIGENSHMKSSHFLRERIRKIRAVVTVESIGKFAKRCSDVVSILTLAGFLFAVIGGGRDLARWLFPPPSFAGAWKGRIEGSEITFCFEQFGQLAWGEFQFPLG